MNYRIRQSVDVIIFGFYRYQPVTLVLDGKYRLFIGTIDAAADRNLLKYYQISSILTLCQEEQIAFHAQESIKHKVIPLGDNLQFNLLPYLDETYAFIEQCLQSSNMLVHCIVGKSRSAAVVLAYLMRSQNIDLGSALSWLKKVRPGVNPNPSFIKQLLQYEHRLFSQIRSKLTPQQTQYYFVQYEIENQLMYHQIQQGYQTYKQQKQNPQPLKPTQPNHPQPPKPAQSSSQPFKHTPQPTQPTQNTQNTQHTQHTQHTQPTPQTQHTQSLQQKKQAMASPQKPQQYQSSQLKAAQSQVRYPQQASFQSVQQQVKQNHRSQSSMQHSQFLQSMPSPLQFHPAMQSVNQSRLRNSMFVMPQRYSHNPQQLVF